MAMLALFIVGAAAGLIATRLMRIETDLVSTIAIGVLGALAGSMILRFIVMITSWAAGFLGLVLGAMALIWLWSRFVDGRR